MTNKDLALLLCRYSCFYRRYLGSDLPMACHR